MDQPQLQSLAYSERRSNNRSNRSITAAVIALSLIFAIVAREPSAKASSAGPELPLVSAYVPDFSGARVNGIGLKFTNVAAPNYFVDFRLNGYPGSDPVVNGKSYEFQASPSLRVSYEVEANSVKEALHLDRGAPSTFSFSLNTPGLSRSITSTGAIELSPAGQPWMFRLEAPTADDSAGRSIPAKFALSANTLTLSLDQQSVQEAVWPITIDPTIIGAPAGATAGGQARKLFRTEDGGLIFFDRESVGGVFKFVYRTSSDGNAWSDPNSFADAGPSGDISVVQAAGDLFLTAYSTGTSDSPKISFRSLTKSGPGWIASAERQVSTLATWWRPGLTLVDRGPGPLGENLAVGFNTYNSVFSRNEYAVAFSQDSGSTWLLLSTCATDTGTGTIVVIGQRLLCITSGSSVNWAEWNGTQFSAAQQILGSIGNDGDKMPSTVVDADGRLHLVFNSWGSVYYAGLAPGASAWSDGKYLGKGINPVISLSGKSLFAFAQTKLSSKESQIVEWVATDGKTWNPGTPLGGHVFQYVLDYNDSWAFRDERGDGVFSISDSAGTIGNQIGTSSVFHVLDSSTKKASFGFLAPSAGANAVNSIKLWATASSPASSPTYRVGLQSADPVNTSRPSGHYLGEVVAPDGSLVAGSFTTFSIAQGAPPSSSEAVNPDAAGVKSVTVSIPAASLSAGVGYFVMVEPLTSCGTTPSCSIAYGPTNWLAVEAAGADSSAAPDLSVSDYNAGVWTSPSNQVPRFLLSGPSGSVISQIIGASTRYPALDHQTPGESFVAPRNLSATSARVYLIPQGSPSGNLSLSILDTANNRLLTQSFTPLSGWNSVSFPALSLTSGNRYRLVVESSNTDIYNYWTLRSSGDLIDSWAGTGSLFSRALDKKGLFDRSAAAQDIRSGVVWDFWAFNTSSNDALYVGDGSPFPFVNLSRQAGTSLASLGTSLSYWNGSAWTALSTSRNQLLASDGDASFTPPSDWAASTPADWSSSSLASNPSYWLKVSSTSGAPAGVLVDRITSIRNLQTPSSSPSISGDHPTSIPVAYADITYPPGITFSAYDAVPPTMAPEVVPNPFTPNADGIADSAHIGASFGEAASWKLAIQTPAAQTIRQASGSGPSMNFDWDGKNDNGVSVTDGTYRAVVTFVDSSGNQTVTTVFVTKGAGPVISSVSPLPAQVGQTVTVTGSFGPELGLHELSTDQGSLSTISWSENSITAVLPAGFTSGDHQLRVWNGGLTSSPVTMTVANYSIPAPGAPTLPGWITFKAVGGADGLAIASSHSDTASQVFPGETDPVLSRWFKVPVTETVSSKVLEYSADTSIEWAEIETPARPASVAPNDPDYNSGKQWGLGDAPEPEGIYDADIDAPNAWVVSQGSPSVTISVIDSGISAHPDLSGNLVTGTDYTGSATTSDGCIGTPTGSHGTEVAGISSAVTNNGIGMAGVAWNGKVRPVKVLSSVGGQCKWAATSGTFLANAIRDASLNSQVINLSLTGQSFSLLDSDAVQNAWAAGRVIIAAAGNDSSIAPAYPAAYDNVIAVGSVNKDQTKTTFTNSNPPSGAQWVDVFAPGVDIYSTTATATSTGYGTVTGTSFSSSFASGVAVLLLAKGKDNKFVVASLTDPRTVKGNKDNIPKLLWADGALIRFVPVTLPDGMFVYDYEKGLKYLIDRGRARPVNSWSVLNSWGVYGAGSADLIYVEHSRLLLPLERVYTDFPLAFRPGVVLRIKDPDPSQANDLLFYLPTSDPDTRYLDQGEVARWLHGRLGKMTPAVFACLGYKQERIREVSKADMIVTYGPDFGNSSYPLTSCFHPNGTLIGNLPGSVVLKDRFRGEGNNRLLTPGYYGTTYEKSTVLPTWGMGNESVNDATLGLPLLDQAVTPSGGWLGLRPGTAATFGTDDGQQYPYNSRQWWFVTMGTPTRPLTDFAAGPVERFRDYRTMLCYGFSWYANSTKELRDDSILTIHPGYPSPSSEYLPC
ncbi:MAG: S8 family serine peptidase [Actinomycetota bacterium]